MVWQLPSSKYPLYLFSPSPVLWYDKKHLCSFLTDLIIFYTMIIFVSSKVASAMIWKQSEWDVKWINKNIKVRTKVLRKRFSKMQKQGFTDVRQNRCSVKFLDIRKKKSLLESPFNKVADQKAHNFIKERCFLVNIVKFVGTAFL